MRWSLGCPPARRDMYITTDSSNDNNNDNDNDNKHNHNMHNKHESY